MSKTAIMAISIFVFGAAVGGAGLYLFQGGKVLTFEEAGKTAMDFINKNIEEGVTASLTDISEAGDVYKISLNIVGTDYESYITKDGKFLFPTGINLAEQSKKEQTPESSQELTQEVLGDLAKCLADKGAKFYGASWCGHCKNQKEMFGQAAESLPYVECSTPDGSDQMAVCKENNVTSYPTWEFADGTRETGELSLQKLSEKSGCPISQ